MARSNGHNQMRMIDEQSFRFDLRSNKNKPLFTLSSNVDSDQLLAPTRWQIDHLQVHRDQLNQCKAQVGTFPLHEWEKHTETTEISSNIKRVIMQRFTNKPPILTRAWIKFYDIMGTFPLFGSTDDCTIRSLFLCEAPGAFVNAMNHYIRTNFCNMNFDWIATTLNPYYEQIDFDAFVLDDRFIQDSHLFQNWFFASDNTGDLLNDKFLDDLKDHIRTTYQLPEADNCPLFDCITGDGAFNCLNDPERQEEMVFKLIFKEVMVGTRFLKHSGSMVVKFFTFFSCETISLLYFLCNCFKEVTCYKPVASKHGNSEIYLVCLKFDRNVYKSLLPHFSGLQAEEFMLKRDLIGQDFIDLVSALCQQISSRQMESINANVSLFNQSTSEQMKTITRNKYALGQLFIQKFNLFSIPLNEQLIFGDRYRKIFSKRFYALFDEYQHHNSKSIFCSKLAKLIDGLTIDSTPQMVAIQNRTNPKYKPTYGLPFEHINNSKFCCPFVLRSFIIANSHSPFTSDVTCTELFLDVLQSVVKVHHHICFYQKTPFSEYLDEELTSRHSTGVQYCTLDQSSHLVALKSPVIHFLDLYDPSPSITSNDFVLCRSLKDSFTRLVGNNHLQTNQVLAIRLKILLSRLSASLVCVIIKAFRKVTIFPHFTPTDSIHPSLFVVMSGYRQLPSQYACFLDKEQSRHKWTSNLLELVPVPDIVSDQNLFEALFNANSVSILNCIKQQLVGIREENNVQ